MGRGFRVYSRLFTREEFFIFYKTKKGTHARILFTYTYWNPQNFARIEN